MVDATGSEERLFRTGGGTFWKRQEVIDEIERGRNLLGVSAVENDRGQRFVDLRTWFQDRESGEWKATQKGVTIPVDQTEAVSAAIASAAKRSESW